MENNDKIVSGLRGKDKVNPFSVPRGYFESFPGKIVDRLQKEKVVPLSPAERIWQVLQPQLALVAAITGFAVLGYIGFRSFTQTRDEWLSTDHISEYVDNYSWEFNDYHLLSLIDDYGFSIETEIYNDEEGIIVDYLYLNEIDIFDILTEY